MMDSSNSSCIQQSSEKKSQHYSCAADQRAVNPLGRRTVEVSRRENPKRKGPREELI